MNLDVMYHYPGLIVSSGPKKVTESYASFPQVMVSLFQEIHSYAGIILYGVLFGKPYLGKGKNTCRQSLCMDDNVRKSQQS